MIANFKNDKRIIITGADRAEALLIQNLVDASKTEGNSLSLSLFYDVVGDVNGFTIDLNQTTVNTPTEEPTVEPENDNENEEGE